MMIKWCAPCMWNWLVHEKSKPKFIVSVADTCASRQRAKFYFFFKVQPGEYYRLESHLDDIMTPIPALMRSLCLDEEEEEEYLPTPTPNRGLEVLNQHIERLSGGRISPVLFQLTQPITRCRQKHALLHKTQVKRSSRNNTRMYCTRAV